MPKRRYAEQAQFDLEQFALDVLAILEDDKEWSSETLADIAIAANARNLAYANDAGMFTSLIDEVRES